MTRLRLTAACPADLQADAAHLAMALAESEADALTYAHLAWQDAQGRLYACASFMARPEWIAAAQSGLQRPAWDVAEVIDMAAAGRAQAALVFWSGTGPVPQPGPGKLTVIGGMEGVQALAAMGLSPVEIE